MNEKFIFPIAVFFKTELKPTIILSKEDLNEECEIGPKDSFEEWKNAEIIDSSGRVYHIIDVFVRWPKSKLGRLISKIVSQAFFIDFTLKDTGLITINDFKSLFMSRSLLRSKDFEASEGYEEIMKRYLEKM